MKGKKRNNAENMETIIDYRNLFLGNNNGTLLSNYFWLAFGD